MLTDKDLETLASDVASISDEDSKHHENVQDLLTKFKTLLKDYCALKSDYDEVKEGREKYKRQARNQERNPFVLVLIDGDGYLFNEDHIDAGTAGGIQAARDLSDSIHDLMHETPGVSGGQCRVMVRVYANILGLSKVLIQAGFIKNVPRSLSTFTSAFTRAQDLFDFVDAGEKKEGSDFKIRELFRLFADIKQCQHIYFAGCHDAGYLSMLTPYTGKSDRITLIKGASFHRDFEGLGLPIKELPSIFMRTRLMSVIPRSSAHNNNGSVLVSTKREATAYSIEHGIESPIPPPISGHTEEYFSAILPPRGATIERHIPLNKYGERLDMYCPRPSENAFAEYYDQVQKHKICNSYHLSGQCTQTDCVYDHGDVSESIIEVLRYIMLQYPCSRAGACRSTKCYFGHICQRPGCTGAGGRQCRFNKHAHNLDLCVANWVAVADDPRFVNYEHESL